MLLYTTIMLLRFDCKFYIIRDYIITLEYVLTNIDYIRVSSLYWWSHYLWYLLLDRLILMKQIPKIDTIHFIPTMMRSCNIIH
jgi:hypothetical protein